MASVLIPLADGFEEIEALTPIDVMRRGGVEVVTASLNGTKEVEGLHGTSLKADARFEEVEGQAFDAILLPGGGRGTENLKRSEALLERLRRQHEEGRLICAICAAPTVLVLAGVLEPETCVTCYPTLQMELDRAWSDAPVVADGLFITAQGPGSAMLFSLVVLERLVGEEIAGKVARGMVTDVFG